MEYWTAKILDNKYNQTIVWRVFFCAVLTEMKHGPIEKPIVFK